MINPPQIISNESELPSGIRIIDITASMEQELFAVRNPSIRKGTEEFTKSFADLKQELEYVFVYYPWQNSAVKMLPEAEYFELRTARNQDLITKDEQKKFRAATVGVAGLSVGSAIVHALVRSGGPQKMKIADMDAIEVTNLNRIHANILDLGVSKVDTIARVVWEIDPYTKLELFPEGITDKNLDSFVKNPKLDIVIDEMESMEFKVKLRYVAKKEGVPVIMATDNGNGIILDVERFDLEPNRPLFHGLLNDADLKNTAALDFAGWLALAIKIVGEKELGERMRISISELGRSIASIPQLGSSALFAGAAVSHAVRLVASGDKLPSGRYSYSLDTLTAHSSL